MNLLVATSVSPFHIEKQKEAMASWQKLDARVVSLNHSSEAPTIRNEFPEIEVVELDRSAMEMTGKPLVYIDDFFKTFLNSPQDNLCITNSDIHLREIEKFKIGINSLDFDLIFGQRLDVSSILETEGEVFEGFDFFVFSKELASKMPETTFCMGWPWWDHWVPMASILLNAKVYMHEKPLVSHVLHDVNYGIDSLGKMGEELDAQLIALYTHFANEINQESPGALGLLMLAAVFSSYFQSKRKIISDLYPKFEELNSTQQDEVRLEMAWIMPVLTMQFIKSSARKISFEAKPE